MSDFQAANILPALWSTNEFYAAAGGGCRPGCVASAYASDGWCVASNLGYGRGFELVCLLRGAGWTPVLTTGKPCKLGLKTRNKPESTAQTGPLRTIGAPSWNKFWANRANHRARHRDKIFLLEAINWKNSGGFAAVARGVPEVSAAVS